MIWLCWAGPTASGAAEGGSRGEQCRRSTKDDHYNMQSTQKSFPLQCAVERLLGSAIKKSLSPSPDTTMGDCLQLSPWHQSCFKNVFHSPSAIPLHAWTPKPCGAVQFWSSAEKDVGMGNSNLWASRRRDCAVPQSWNMSSLFKSVKIFKSWFHVIETWVSYRIWRISNPKQLAQIIQHLTGLVFLHAGGAEKAILSPHPLTTREVPFTFYPSLVQLGNLQLCRQTLHQLSRSGWSAVTYALKWEEV